jgi:hypothetical protein
MLKPDNIKLVDEVHNIFQAMRPTFLYVARGYRIPNINSYVDEWLARAFFIAKKFDDGELHRKALSESGLDEAEESDSEVDFLKLFRAYLKTSFKNDLNRDYGKRQKTVAIEDMIARPSSSGEQWSASDRSIEGATLQPNIASDSANIPDMLEIVCSDLDKAHKDEEFAADRVNVIFYGALRSALIGLGQIWMQDPVIPNFTSTQNKDYFDPDFRTMLTPRVMLYMAEAAIAEDSPLVASKVADICLSHAGMALQRRMYRYFFDYQGGLQKRIPRFRAAKKKEK